MVHAPVRWVLERCGVEGSLGHWARKYGACSCTMGARKVWCRRFTGSLGKEVWCMLLYDGC